MAVLDWVQKKVTGTLSIVEDPAPDKVFKAALDVGQQAFMLYVGKTDFVNSEIIAEDKAVVVAAPWWEFLAYPSYVYRSDAALDNAYIVYHSRKKVYISKYDGGVFSVLLTSPDFGLVFPGAVWHKLRIRCWDAAFPSNCARFTIEQWSGAAWILRWQVDEATAFLLGASGRSGFGVKDYPGYASEARFNNVDLGHMV